MRRELCGHGIESIPDPAEMSEYTIWTMMGENRHVCTSPTVKVPSSILSSYSSLLPTINDSASKFPLIS